MSERIYGPGPIRSRKATCPDCKRDHVYYGQASGGRKRCHSCAGAMIQRKVWVAAWRRVGEVLRWLGLGEEE